jgi:ATP-dependent helicase/DNAse subunit B
MAQKSQKSFICTCSDEKTNKNTLKIFNGEENKEKNIIAIDCKNPADEIRSVIYEIKKKTSEGYHYSDMCILSGTPDLYAPYTEKLLTASDIPFFMDKKVALSKNPVCKFFINMLSSVKENYHYEDISCFVKSISFMCDAFSEITLFETYISNFRIKKSVLLNKAEWKSSYEIAKLKNSFLIKNEKSIQKVYDKFITPLAESFKPLKKKNKAEVYTNAIKAFIKETHFEKLLKSYIDTLSDFNEKQLYINASLC